MATLLLRVPVGSVLTGFAIPGSDTDWMEVWDKVIPSHTTDGVEDVTRWTFGIFTAVLARGGHNALEACFAPDHLFEVDLLRDFRHSYRANPYAVWETYYATVLGSSRSLRNQPLKAEIFTRRLLFDRWACLDNYGRFDPTAFRRTSGGERLYQRRLGKVESDPYAVL